MLLLVEGGVDADGSTLSLACRVAWGCSLKRHSIDVKSAEASDHRLAVVGRMRHWEVGSLDVTVVRISTAISGDLAVIWQGLHVSVGSQSAADGGGNALVSCNLLAVNFSRQPSTASIARNRSSNSDVRVLRNQSSEAVELLVLRDDRFSVHASVIAAAASSNSRQSVDGTTGVHNVQSLADSNWITSVEGEALATADGGVDLNSSAISLATGPLWR